MVRSGSKVTLQVEVTGVPAPEVKWYRNGGPLQDSPDCRISSCGNVHTLLINEVRFFHVKVVFMLSVFSDKVILMKYA